MTFSRFQSPQEHDEYQQAMQEAVYCINGCGSIVGFNRHVLRIENLVCSLCKDGIHNAQQYENIKNK